MNMRPPKFCMIQHLLSVLVCAVAAIAAACPCNSETSQLPPIAALIDSLNSTSAFDSVLTLIPSALADAEARGDSSLTARLLAAKGRAEIMTGKLAEGILSFDASISLARSVRDTTTWMNALGYKSLAVAWQGRHDECIELNETRLELALLTGSRASEAWARVGLGYIYMLRGELNESKTEYEAAVDIFRAENLPRDELTPLIGLGRVFTRLNDIVSARQVFIRAWVVAHDLGDRIQEAYATNNLGTLELDGDISLAVQYFERAYHLHLAIGDTRGAITPATNVALARIYLGQFQEAGDILIQAAEKCREGDFQNLLGQVLVRLGEVRYNQGRMHASAKLHRESLGIGGALSKKSHDEAVWGLARSLIAMDSISAAVEILEMGLEAPLPVLEPHMKILMSQCLRRLGRPAEALEYSLDIERRMEARDFSKWVVPAVEVSSCYRELGRKDKALDAFMMAADRLEGRRQATESLRWREARGGNRELVDASAIVLEYPPELPESKRVEALFNIFQRFKARTLVERITEPRHQVEPSSEFADLQTATLSRLQQDILEPGELFLDIIVGYHTCYLFAVTQDSCRVVELPGFPSGLSERIELFLRAMGKPPRLGGSDANLDGMALRTSLGKEILGEVADFINDSSRLLVAPDLDFGNLPFGLLAVEVGGESNTALLESKAVHYVPSATILQWLRRKRPADAESRPGALLVLVPWDRDELKGVDREVKFIERRYSRVLLGDSEAARTVITDTDASFEVIHAAAHIEVNDERPWRSGILLGEPQEQSGGRARADIASVDIKELRSVPQSDEFGPSDIQSDPYIRANDIAGSRIRAKIVVLSGCESALGRLRMGEGLTGLTSAFLSAGVPITVATLWPVDDRVTADLMKTFYLSLEAGLPSAAALREAQSAIRSRRRTRHPFYWAGFVIVGDGNISVLLEVDGTRNHIPLLVALVSAMVVLVAVVFRLRYKKAKKSTVSA
jgi:CHAT domain-containing protein/tetratricopeptide (TPR) repeat protein